MEPGVPIDDPTLGDHAKEFVRSVGRKVVGRYLETGYDRATDLALGVLTTYIGRLEIQMDSAKGLTRQDQATLRQLQRVLAEMRDTLRDQRRQQTDHP